MLPTMWLTRGLTIPLGQDRQTNKKRPSGCGRSARPVGCLRTRYEMMITCRRVKRGVMRVIVPQAAGRRKW
jgi:hypothetical protein